MAKIERHARIAVMGAPNRVYPRWDVVHGHDAQWGLQTRMQITRECFEKVPGLLGIRPLPAENCTWCRVIAQRERPADAHPRRADGTLYHSRLGCYFRVEVPEHNGKRVRFRDFGEEFCRQEFNPWEPFSPTNLRALALDEERYIGLPLHALRHDALTYSDLYPLQALMPERMRRQPFAGPRTWAALALEDTTRRCLEKDNQNRAVLHGRAHRLAWEDLDRKDLERITAGGIVRMNLSAFEALMVRKGAAEVRLAAQIFGKRLNERHLDYEWEAWWWTTQYLPACRRQFGDFPELLPARDSIMRLVESNGSYRAVPSSRQWLRRVERETRQRQDQEEPPAWAPDRERETLIARARRWNWQTDELEAGAQVRPKVRAA